MTRAKRNLPFDIYLRISLDKENDEKGVERQERDCRKEAKRRGLTVGRVIIDNDTSATSGKRMPGREELYERMRSGQSGGVIVYHIKRLLRRVIDMEALIELVESSGAEIVSIMSSDLDLSTASGRAVARVFAAFGEMEVDEIKERMRSYFADRAARGEPHKRGRRPFGWNNDWKTLNKKEAELYREMFQQVIDGVSLGAIAEDWERRGILDSKGKRYSIATLQVRIKSPRAIGRATYKGEDVGPGDWEPIVTPDVQRAAIAALRSRQQRHLRSVGPKRKPQLLSSIAACGGCGQMMRVSLSGGTLTYRCDRTNNGRSCGKSSIVCALAEREVETRFLVLLTEPKTHKALERLRRQRPDTSLIVDEIERIELEIAEAANDKASGLIDRKTWLTLHEGATARLDDAKERLSASGDSPALLAASPEDTVKRWNKFDLDEKRRRLAPWVNTIRVMPLNGTGGSAFKPERVKVDWRV